MIENQKIDVKKLRGEKLGYDVDYSKIEAEKKMHILDSSMKRFLSYISTKQYFSFYDEKVYFVEMKKLNKNENKIDSRLCI